MVGHRALQAPRWSQGCTWASVVVALDQTPLLELILWVSMPLHFRSCTQSYSLSTILICRNTPRLLFGAAAALLAAAPALVYFVPDTSNWLIAGQVAAAVLLVLGGTAAYGGAALLTALHK